ncbi:MAG: hypothetical protein K1X31_00150 [Gemmatimonadaceae bacterium]|nr:hypothetical protein [Gemmatimonadaceae bacterium]
MIAAVSFTDPGSVFVAQALSAAIAISYGLAFIGLWLLSRQRVMSALARAWLAFSAVAATSPLLASAGDLGAAAPLAEAATIGLALLAVAGFLDVTLVALGHDAARRRWRVAVFLGVGGIVLAMLGGVGPVLHAMRGPGPRLLAVGVLGATAVVLMRTPPFPGRRYLALGNGFLLLRFVAGLALELLAPGAVSLAGQPVSFTLLQLIALVLAGYAHTAAAFAVSHDAELRQRLALERSLGQAQRLGSIGRMAGGVAHDFNNILGAVLGATELVVDDAATPAERADAAAVLHGAVARGRALTRQLLEFSRPDDGAVDEFDPSQRLADLVPMIRRLAGPRVTVELAPGAVEARESGTVRASAVQFDQVLLNLAANARDAMPGGGCLRLGYAVEDAPAADAGTARITVADDGAGMPPEVLERIFEPFFTTKPTGEGTGLGLATAFAFAKHAGGDLRAESRPGAGSTFTLMLPLRRGPRRRRSGAH